jgi:hypothetical protein
MECRREINYGKKKKSLDLELFYVKSSRILVFPFELGDVAED